MRPAEDIRLFPLIEASDNRVCSRCCATIPHPALVAGSLVFHGKTVRRLILLVERLVHFSKLPRRLL
jgi:hypothetical protein